MAPLKYWLWLSTRRGAEEHPELLCRLLEQFGTPEAVYFADPEEYRRIPELPPLMHQELEDKTLDSAEAILERCARLDLHIMTVQDTDYPDRLRQIRDYPLVLYRKGKWFPLDEMLTIGMVGTRKATPYGVNMAATLSMDLSRGGAVVASGMAEGIDTASVKGALQAGGTPISVLGGGIDVPYPYENRFLYDDVAAVGALLSEYPPGTRPQGFHFPVRNRIISGLSCGVIAVEGAERSGTMITMRLALEQNRDTYAVPGNADAPMSRGTNRLIQRGEAQLLLNAGEILEEYAGRYTVRLKHQEEPLTKEEREARLSGIKMPERREKRNEPPKPKTEEPPRPTMTRADASAQLSEEQMAILEAVADTPLLTDEIIEKTGLPAHQVMAALTILQVGGFVQEQAGKRFFAAIGLEP